MGGRAGTGGGRRIPSDAYIEKMAKDWVPGDSIYVPSEPQLMSGEITAHHVYDYNKGTGQWTNASSPQIEAQISKDAGQSPEIPSGKVSNKAKAEFLKAYDTYHDKYMKAMKKGVSEYKSLISKTKNPALKSLLANHVKQYQGYMKDASGTKEWIHKIYQ